MRASAALPDVFATLNYRQWLRDAIAAIQAVDPTWTQRRLSAAVGLKSSGGLALVVGGHRRLTPETARRVAAAFGLTPAEREHLAASAELERTTDPARRAQLVDRMRASTRFAELWQGSLATLDFYRSWYLPVLRELVALDAFVEDAAWVAARLRPPISAAEAAAGIDALLRMGFVTRDADGRLRQSAPIVATHPELASDALVLHQQHMMRLASTAIVDQPPQQRDMRVVTAALSRSQAERIKARLELFQREVLAIVAEDEPIEVVYQLNTQWFAVAEAGGEGASSARQKEEECEEDA